MRPQWNELTRPVQDLYLILLWKDGHTEQAIADFLGTTKGRIVRRRHSHLTSLVGPRTRARVKSSVDEERFRDLLDLHMMAEIEKSGVTLIGPVQGCEWPTGKARSLKKADSCGEPPVPGRRLCAKHLAIALGR
ncbi:hypothetical protein A2704_01275 [Candidatus Kaiserbacteria bacterium RIFCSPHIGHO2_01_FULL_54_36b]|uniref:Uncharacterized protein n=1 Tax=Candidatus Kaiserbacteria bacterium RIFCSPHIGHO2_01_FULL_54_36b TaxID=1798483 RepID=A0A1F6CLP8_9BACT|nr:MAG: hypothetical protein A2704_01275 [Candidatus Kaiserbacteria bacterium RIFCSPHIGHO2_01_FULL_54_36b]